MDKALLEAIANMDRGLLEYNRGVLAAIGQTELATRWKFAVTTSDIAAAALHQKMATKHSQDALAQCLDPGTEFPEAAALDAANQAEADAWKPIRALIEEARLALYRV